MTAASRWGGRMPSGHGRYPSDLKEQAVRRSRSGDATVAELSRELGVSDSTIRRWLREAEHDAPTDEQSRPPGRARLAIPAWGEDLPVRRLAGLAADAIEIAAAAVIIPFPWAASRLRGYAEGTAPEAPGDAEPADAGERAQPGGP